MRRTGLLWVVIAAIAIIISGCSRTEGRKPPSSDQPAERSGAVGTGGAGANLSDDGFVRDVALKNMAEVELSRLALDKATNLDIKSFAQRMIDDHGGAGQNLKSAVLGQPIEWTMALDDKHRKTVDELAQKQGADSIATMSRQWSRATRTLPRSSRPRRTEPREPVTGN